jgi:hypothetical protein
LEFLPEFFENAVSAWWAGVGESRAPVKKNAAKQLQSRRKQEQTLL